MAETTVEPPPMATSPQQQFFLADSPYIHPCFNLSSMATFFCPQGGHNNQGFWQVAEEKVKFWGIFRDKFAEKLADFAGVFGKNFTKKQSVKNGRFCGYFQGKFRLQSIAFAMIRPAFLTFFLQRSSFALSTTICSRNEPMAKPLTSWLVPSFSQHNLRLIVLGCCLHVSVTKF